jgi:hypothetical protein
MIYTLTAAAAAYLLLLVCLAQFSKKLFESGIVILTGLMAFAIFLGCGGFGAMTYFTASTVPLRAYAQQLHQEIPELKGRLVCSNDTLRFEGTIEVQFTWKENPYLVRYPATIPLRYHATSCLLNIHSPLPTAIQVIRKRHYAYRNTIMQSLSNNAVPAELEGAQRSFTTRLINTLNPVWKKPISALSTEGAPKDRLVIHQFTAPAATNILVPKKQMHGSTQVTTLTIQELQSNISGQ